ALALAHRTLLALFAPFLPFVTEEVWSWHQAGSIHRSAWPDATFLAAAAGDADPGLLDVAAAVLGEVRKAKTTAQRSLRSEVARVVVTDTAARLATLSGAAGDLREAGRITDLELVEGAEASVAVSLAQE
ncbi:MAG TPA: class I tRNA ligase family protein, partial [Acidimicrobiales bacterium]|nr:class I tRNA ligase family protein [Acidimicrobiales bacterium]